MKAYSQILSAVVRCGPEAGKWKDPYCVSTTYSAVDPITAVAHTVWREDDPPAGKPKIIREHIDAMTACIFADGFDIVWWTRIKNGKKRKFKMMNPNPKGPKND